MPEMITLTVSRTAAADNDSLGVQVPVASTLVGFSVAASTPTGSPTAASLTLSDSVLDEVAAVALAPTGGWVGAWRSRHLGGAHDPVPLPAGALLNTMIYLSGGSSPTLDYTATIWLVV